MDARGNSVRRALPKDWAPIIARARAHEGAPGLVFWISAAFLLVGLNLYAPGEPTEVERLLASLMILVTTSVIWFSMYRRDVEIAFMPLFAIVFTITYGLGVFLLTSAAYFGSSPMSVLAETYDRVLFLS